MSAIPQQRATNPGSPLSDEETTLPELCYVPGNASIIPHIILEELGIKYTLRLIDRSKGDDRTPEFLTMNPNGFVPVLIDRDITLHETAAIILHLLERHSDSGLRPPLASAKRSEFFKWLMWLTNTLQPTMKMVFLSTALGR